VPSIGFPIFDLLLLPNRMYNFSWRAAFSHPQGKGGQSTFSIIKLKIAMRTRRFLRAALSRSKRKQNGPFICPQPFIC
jgi:hypothetical protein